MTEYTTFKLAEGLAIMLDEYMEKHPEKGYRTRTELVIDIIRDFLKNDGIFYSNNKK